jgi:hypothetical protein
MRLVALLVLHCLLLVPPLAALDATPEATRWARRALLDETVRKHLELRVGETDLLNTVLFAPCDIDGAPAHAVVLRRNETSVVTIQRNLQCLGRCVFKSSGGLQLSSRVLVAQTWIFVDETAVSEGQSVTHRRILNLRGSELAVRQSWVRSISLTMDKRFRRELAAELRADNGALVLTTRVTDQLDGEAMQDGESEQVLRLTPQPDGSLRTQVELDKPVAVSVRLRHARTLEREHLHRAALMLAREARDAAAKLPADDARRLDADGLVSRFEARIRPEAAQVSPKR